MTIETQGNGTTTKCWFSSLALEFSLRKFDGLLLNLFLIMATSMLSLLLLFIVPLLTPRHLVAVALEVILREALFCRNHKEQNTSALATTHTYFWGKGESGFLGEREEAREPLLSTFYHPPWERGLRRKLDWYFISRHFCSMSYYALAKCHTNEHVKENGQRVTGRKKRKWNAR